MNVHISYRSERLRAVENEINQQIEKLGRRMRVFRPELVHLHGDVAPGPSRKNSETSISLNLRMPSGQITASSSASHGSAAVKEAFRELITQLDAHKERLRNSRNFNRKTAQVHGVPFEETLASVPAPAPNPQATNGDIHLFVNANVPDLERFVRRQIRLRVGAGEVSPNLVSVEEVLDETIANALDEHAQHPDLMSIEHWLYRLAMQAVDLVAERNRSIGDVHIEEPRGEQNVTGSDENYLQFHQPDDQMYNEDFIPDRTVSNPEQIVYSRESLGQVGGALACLAKEERDVFVLYALEGFSVSDISRISEWTEQEVRESLHSARRALERRLSPDNAYRSLLKAGTQIA